MAARDDLALRAAMQAAINAAGDALAACALPVVAFVDGDAIGGGCALALACDAGGFGAGAFRHHARAAGAGLSAARHRAAGATGGAGPGAPPAADRATAGRRRSLRIGLAEEIAPSAHALLATIAANSAFSCAAARSTVSRILDGQRHEDAASLALFASAFDGEDFAQRAARFLAKKPAPAKG
jgi:enoyl-CoA hydratase/carnithine racemase